MSAIFGILRFDGEEMNARDLERMSHTLAHRGPDGRKFVVDGAVGLGHCLMRVNNEDVFEAQPLCDREADLTLVADCRIDNREELAGIFGIGTEELRDMPDSALVLRAYRTWGDNAPQHLLGDFAFAIWDARTRKLVLARDHMGQRSIHYHRGKGFFAFATQADALWQVPGVPRKLSDASLGHYLLFAQSTTSNASLFEGISFVLGGSMVVVRADGDVAERRYWEPRPDPDWLNRTEDEYVVRYRSVLAEAVECRIHRLIAPPAILLSGGFDSGAIAGLSGPVLTAQGRKLIGVSCVMAEDYVGPRLCPRRWIELCRRRMPHLDMHYFVRTVESGFDNLEQTYAERNGIPDLTHHITRNLLERASAAGARLIMDGLAGDETLNPRASYVLRDLLRSGQFRCFLREAVAHRRMGTRSMKQIIFDDIIVGKAPLWLLRLWRRVRRGGRPVWEDWPIAPSFTARLIDTGAFDPADIRVRLMEIMSKSSRVKLTLLTLMSMPLQHHANEAAAHGLDLTKPMLDKRVVEFGQAIPLGLYVKNGRDRHLARRALIDVYPPEFQTRDSQQTAYSPDYIDAFYAELPRLRARIDRLAGNDSLKKYFDFEKLASALDEMGECPPLKLNVGQALRGLQAAAYISWFNRSNV